MFKVLLRLNPEVIVLKKLLLIIQYFKIFSYYIF